MAFGGLGQSCTEESFMDIAIIGAGNVGGTLGTRWAQGGHHVTFGVRDVHDRKNQELLRSAGPSARVASVSEAAAGAAVVLLSTPWTNTQEALRSAGDLSSKVLIDATNPILLGPDLLKEGLLVGHKTSGAEQVASWASGARVVKGFNSVGWPIMANPRLGTQPASMLICGDDSEAKTVVTQLSDELGFETVDVGPLALARLLEPYGMLWIQMCVGLGWGPDFAFHVIKR
jgi:predicted dinucleotide-binding enzyme